jgi:hypothetical protein
MYVGPPDVHYFFNILWVISRRMRHSLDYCARTTGRTLGLPNVRLSDKELVADFPYKCPPPALISHAHSHPLLCPLAARTPFHVLRESLARKSASKRSFQGGEAMSMLSFGVILVSLTFNTVMVLVLCLVEFSKCSSSFFLKVIMFARNSFKIPLCCDFLHCMCYFICLEEVWRSRSEIGIMHYPNLKTVCLRH